MDHATMKNNPVKVDAHGSRVWSNVAVDELRRTECLCVNCGRLRTGSADNCQFAQRLYEICKDGSIALLLTRCKHWEPNTGRTGGM